MCSIISSDSWQNQQALTEWEMKAALVASQVKLPFPLACWSCPAIGEQPWWSDSMSCYKIQYKPNLPQKLCFRLTACLKYTPFARWLITQYKVLPVKWERHYTASVPGEEARTSPGLEGRNAKRETAEDGEGERPEKSAVRREMPDLSGWQNYLALL